VAQSLQKNQGRLVLGGLRDVVLTRLGFWSMFGYLGWQGAEAALNAEYRGQYAIVLATVAAELQSKPEADPSLALYAEYALDYQLTEALKDGQLLGLKAAGGRTASDWQIRLSGRCEELRQALAPARKERELATDEHR
jgi:hypothetical protein